MKDLNEFDLAHLARELAMNIRHYKAVFEDFGITEEDYYEIEKIEFFRRAKEQFALEWNSALSAADRAKLISASYIENLLPIIGKRMRRESEPLASIIEGGKLLTRIAGMGEAKGGAANAAERFTIKIIMNDIEETYDKSIEIKAEPDPVETARKALTAGETNGES